MKKLYIAYGSNMDEEQMAERCPTARLLGKGEIEDYQLLFKGPFRKVYATIEFMKNGRVPVLLWEIEETDEAALDCYEEFPDLYYKKKLTVKFGGKNEEAMVYIMDEKQKLGRPSNCYYKVLEKAYRKFGFSEDILKFAYKESAGISNNDTI